MRICQILLLQLLFDIYSVLNEKQLCFYIIWFVHIQHVNHKTMTTSGLIMSWSDYLIKTKGGNVNIKLWELWETLIVYILLSTFQLVHMVLTVNKPHVRRFIAWIESADWNLDWSSLWLLWSLYVYTIL